MATDGRLEPYREVEFPNLVATGDRVTSPTSRAYNCFAWAAGEDDRWWNPLEPQNPYYWVDGVPAELTIAAFIRAYGTLGFGPCEDAGVEVGFEKIVLLRRRMVNRLIRRDSCRMGSGRASWGDGKILSMSWRVWSVKCMER
jgi:hypothetical protein